MTIVEYDSKILPPTPFLVDIYIYYSYFTLFSCWLIAPILFYAILTQSRNLGNFKWLIFNHSFWCLTLESLLGLVKPVFLSPAAGGFQVGIFRDFGSFKSCGIAAIFCFIFSSNCILGEFQKLLPQSPTPAGITKPEIMYSKYRQSKSKAKNSAFFSKIKILVYYFKRSQSKI